MSFRDTHLHVYKCGRCQTTATSAFKYSYSEPLMCCLCHSFMKWLYAEQIVDAEGRALAARGVVYNPTAKRDGPHDPIPCDQPGCAGYYSDLFGYEIEGIGKFCSAQCLDRGVKRQEAALEQPPADLMGVKK